MRIEHRDTPSRNLARVRAHFFATGEAVGNSVPEIVLRSWQRCLTAGLSPDAKADDDIAAARGQLAAARDRNAHLLAHASGIMNHVHAQIRNSGSMVLLADATGMILSSVGDPDFVCRAGKVALAPGAGWGELRRGTNAIGTALNERSAVSVLGAQHYLSQNGFLTCTAAPIHDATGATVGVFDISGDCRSPQAHTLGLVRLSAQLIERRLFESAHHDAILIAFHPELTGLGGMGEGLMAVREDGRIVGLDAPACALLGVDRQRGVGSDFDLLFDTPLTDLLMRGSGASQCFVALTLRGGSRLYASLRTTGAASLRTPASARRTRAVPMPEGARSRASLSTGDANFGRAVDRALRVIDKPIPLLIQGESGVGKEMFAKAFHYSGMRAENPFVALNCAAIPESLIESELFGYVGGAFTGARKEGARGKILQADGGTLFLDEIGDMPLNLQARLLRVLQERCVVPLGGVQATPVDVSLVCATHQNLRNAVREGRFREDLYYRVNALTVTLPPLRERSDINALAQSMLDEACGGSGMRLSDEVSAFFASYAWPGNLRQLNNTIRVAVALCDDDDRVVRVDHLPEELLAPGALACGAADVNPVGSPLADLKTLAHSAIEQALAATGGNVSAAARMLGISRNTLYRKLDQAARRLQ